MPKWAVVSVQFSTVQDGIYALGKAHMRSTPSLRSFPNAAFDTVQWTQRYFAAVSLVHRKDKGNLI